DLRPRPPAADQGGHYPGRRHQFPARLVHPVGDRRARCALPVPGMAAAPVWRADPAFRRGEARNAGRSGRSRPHFALLARQIPALTLPALAATARIRPMTSYAPADNQQRNTAIFLTVAMAAVVGGALGFEHIGHYIPCKLCLEQ